MQGIQSLMQAPQGQGQQGPMPGQAPMQPMQGMMPQQGAPTPGAMTGSLKNMPLDQLKMLYQNPQAGSPPLWAVISALAEKQKEAQAMQAAQGQQAMAQNAQMQQQPPVAAQVMQAADQMKDPVMAAYGGEMHGYAGGGAVSFQKGGDTEVERILKKGPYERTPEENEILRAAGIGVTRQQGLPEGGFLSRINKGLESLIGRTAPVPEETASYDHEGRMGLTSKPVPPAPAPMQPARRPPAGNKPPTMSQGLGGLMSGVEQTGTPAPDTLSDIEAGGIRDIKAMQDVIRQQGAVDPRLAELREAAYKSSQGIAERRERDRQAMLEAAQKTSSASLFDNQEALLRMAGALGGAKRFGEGLSKVAGEAGAIKGEQRKELQRVQGLAREEQNAIDQLNQALADKRVADMTGDVSQRRQADLEVAKAQLKVTDLRSGIQKERATEADRAEQRRLTERGQNVQQQTAREQMANALKVAQTRGALAGERGAITQRDLAKYRFDAEKQVEKLLPEDREYRKLRNDPTAQAAYKENLVRAKVREATLAAGLEPPAGYEKPTTAPAGPATRLRFDAQGNPIK